MNRYFFVCLIATAFAQTVFAQRVRARENASGYNHFVTG